jgi:resuscitation-promoting factor RpfB
MRALSWTVPGRTEAGSEVLALLSGRPGRFAAHAAVLSAVIGASVAYAAANKSITLSVDGKPTTVHAFSTSVEDLLDAQGVTVGTRDIVAPALDAKVGDGDTVVVRYARPLTLTIDGEQKTYWTTALSVDQALQALGVRSDGAALSASRSQPLGRSGLTMWLSTPKQVVLQVDGHRHPLTTTAPTVAALLAKQGVTVGAADRLSSGLAAPLKDGLLIKVVRIATKRVTATESVAFKTTTRKNSDLYKGDTKVITKGRSGKRTAVYDVTLADGKVTKRELVRATVMTEPVTQVEETGTKAKPSGGSVGGDVAKLNWSALAKCESGGNPNARNPAGYYGLYQFSVSTWRSVGGSGVPTDFGAGEQTYRAQLLYKRTGASSWPHCGPRLFS